MIRSVLRRRQAPMPERFNSPAATTMETVSTTYRARYYNSQTERFISEDPIEFAGGNVNLYAYVGNDPIKRTLFRRLCTNRWC